MTDQSEQASNPDVQLKLANTRTALALDRTLLAWIRTALTLIGFGITLIRFVAYVASKDTQHFSLSSVESSRTLGIVMMILGILGLIAAIIDRWKTAENLKDTKFAISHWSISMVMAAVLAVVTVIVTLQIVKETH